MALFQLSRWWLPRSSRRIALLVFAAVCLSRQAVAAGPEQTYSLTNWTDKDGIVGPVSSIAQDQDGYLWLGTFGGLVRFDGVRFVQWPLDGEPSERPISAISASRDGSIWVGFGLRELVARVRGNRVESFRLGDGAEAGFVRNLIEDRSGTMWAAAFGGLWKYGNGKWERIEPAHGLPAGTVDALYEDPHGDLWVGSVAGVFRRRTGSEHFQPVPVPSQDATAPRWFGAGADGSTWMADPRGLIRIGRSDKPQWTSGIPGPRRLLYDGHGSLWVGTLRDGLIRINAGTNSPSLDDSTHFTTRNGLSDDDVRSLFQDREGNIWAGTRTGLTRFAETPSFITSGGEKLGNEVINALATSTDGRIWASSNDGLMVFDNGRWSRIGKPQGLPSDAVIALDPDENRGLWLTTDQGAGHFSAGRFVSLPLPNNIRRVTCIAAGPGGSIWLSDQSMGVFRWKGGKLTSFEHVTGRRPAHVIYTDSIGNVWVALLGAGVIVFNGDQHTTLPENQLAPGVVSAIHEDRNGTVWIASSGGISAFKDGVLVAHRQSTLRDASSLITDDRGFLWLGVPIGLIRIHESELQKASADSAYRIRYRLFSQSDGLHGIPTRNSVWPSATRGEDGTLWFVTNEGVTTVDPNAVDDTVRTPQVRIEAVVADDRSIDIAPGQTIPPLTARIQIDYTALTLAAPEKTRFQYRLEGFDTEWLDAGTRRQAFYTNLPPRRYQFRVRAYEDGAPTESSAQWEFVLAPAFYQTRWFRLLCVATVGLALVLAWRARIRGVHRQFALVMAERARMGRELHDTLLQGLVGALVQFDAVATQLDGTQEAAKARLERARREVEGYIRETRRSILDLRSATPEPVHLDKALREVGESQTAGRPVHFEFAIAGEPRPCDSRFAEQLVRIGSEAVHNAVRHAHATRICMQVNFTASHLRLVVSDDGKGFDVSQSGRPGWGLVSMRERTEQIGGVFSITSTPAEGTTVEVVAALARTHAA